MTKEITDNKTAIQCLEMLIKELKEENIKVDECDLCYRNDYTNSPFATKNISFRFNGIVLEDGKGK